jgi:hypothetical protein
MFARPLGTGNTRSSPPLEVPMVHSSMLVITADEECLTCCGFSLGETIHFESLEFITNYFGSLSLSLRG